MRQTERAHGKINWTLEILGDYPATHQLSGYTRIRSVLSLIDLHDLVALSIDRAAPSGIELHSDNPRLPQTANKNLENNSCTKAVAAFQARYPGLIQGRVQIEIKKRLPLAGGLGGSSTDAAAVLRILFREFQPRETLAEKLELAAAVGSDVPFFISGFKTAEISGRGEIVSEIKSSSGPIPVFLLCSEIESQARDAYQSLRETAWKGCELSGRKSAALGQALNSGTSPIDSPDLLVNDLELAPSTLAAHPELVRARAILLDAGCQVAQMSGSGSVIFGIPETRDIFQSMRERLQRECPEFTLVAAETIAE